MKLAGTFSKTSLALLIVCILSLGTTSCHKDETLEEMIQQNDNTGDDDNLPQDDNKPGNDETTDMKINVTIGASSFTATIEENATGKAFLALLPISVNMKELNGNEKYHYMSGNLPTYPYTPGTINSGDIMLYGSSCIVLFYQTFSSPYSYTRIGKLDNPQGLAETIGQGDVTIKFENKKDNNK